MVAESTPRYGTLRRTKAVLRVLAPLCSAAVSLLGLLLFLGVAPQLASTGYMTSERMIRGIQALGYLVGFPVAGFILYYLLRAGADVVDLWIDSEISQEKTADLVERQLVPGIHRIATLLEKLNETLSGLGSVRIDHGPGSAESRQRASDTVREAKIKK